MNKNILFKPQFGFVGPRGKCKKSEFAGGYHRLAWFPRRYLTDGMPGYVLKRRCVNCGKFIGKPVFKPSIKIKEVDKQIEEYENE